MGLDTGTREGAAAAAMADGLELLGRIGGGAYGEVFLARRGGRWCAVKCVRRGEGQEAADRFEREWRGARMAERMPRIEGLAAVRGVRMAGDGNSFAYEMDLADDEIGAPPAPGTYRPRSLASVIDAEIALPLAECVEIGLRVSGALVELQRRHVVHRDIKPGNILFFGGKAVLADIGLLVDSREASSVVGTPGYVPPEGAGTVGGDIYGLGRTLWRISTGRPPSDVSLLPCPEAEVESPYFWQWLALLARSTARDPALRPQSAKAFLKDLRRLRRAMRLHRHRWLRWAAWAAAVAVAVPLAWTYPEFVSWRLQGGGNETYTVPLPLPWRWAKPISALFPPKGVEWNDAYWDEQLAKQKQMVEESMEQMRRHDEAIMRLYAPPTDDTDEAEDADDADASPGNEEEP